MQCTQMKCLVYGICGRVSCFVNCHGNREGAGTQYEIRNLYTKCTSLTGPQGVLYSNEF